jgi:hypothetical protein
MRLLLSMSILKVERVLDMKELKELTSDGADANSLW